MGNKIQGYKVIIEQHRQDERARQERKWRFLISVATVYALLVAAKHSTYFHFEGPMWSSPWYIVGTSAFLILIVCGFLYRLGVADKQNLKFAERAEHRLAALVEQGADAEHNCVPIFSTEQHRRKHFHSYLRFEITTFVIYGIVATFLIIF